MGSEATYCGCLLAGFGFLTRPPIFSLPVEGASATDGEISDVLKHQPCGTTNSTPCTHLIWCHNSPINLHHTTLIMMSSHTNHLSQIDINSMNIVI
jgi:hypothetical protein